MKKIMTMAMLLGSLALIQSCSKEEGPVGPKGDTGLTGATGATGAAGQNGVSGARAFVYTNNINSLSETISIDSSFVDSCAILVYYQDAINTLPVWYQAPGLGASSTYQTRYFLRQESTSSFTFILNLRNPDGSTYTGNNVTLSKTKIVFIPHTLFGKKDAIDYSDYKATMKHYGLSE